MKNKAIRTLIERDGPYCYICGLCCDLQQQVKQTRISASQDHLIPKAHSGLDSFNNLRLAHRYCNNRRGAKGVNDELREACRSKLLKEFPEAITESESWFKDHIKPHLHMPTHIKEKLGFI